MGSNFPLFHWELKLFQENLVVKYFDVGKNKYLLLKSICSHHWSWAYFSHFHISNFIFWVSCPSLLISLICILSVLIDLSRSLPPSPFPQLPFPLSLKFYYKRLLCKLMLSYLLSYIIISLFYVFFSFCLLKIFASWNQGAIFVQLCNPNIAEFVPEKKMYRRRSKKDCKGT